MKNIEQSRQEEGIRSNNDENISRQNAAAANDLPDNEHDKERMQQEETILDLPEVSDIPGQENVIPPNLEGFADTTASSDDEEGVGLFEDDNADEDTDILMGTEADVSNDEQEILARADQDMPTQDDIRLRRAELDNTDDEGEPLNEGSLATDVSGADLDMNVDMSDETQKNAMGQGDEENGHYSLGSDSNDNVQEGGV